MVSGCVCSCCLVEQFIEFTSARIASYPVHSEFLHIPRYFKHNGNHYDTDSAKASEQRNLSFCISNCKDDQLKVGLKQEP